MVRVVDGKTCSRHVPAADGDRLRQQVQAYWRACEQWADAHLDAPEASERVRPTQEHAEPLSQEIAALFGDTSTGKREHPPRNQD